MKRVRILKVDKVKTRPVMPKDFIQDEVKSVTMKKISKKEIREAAEAVGLAYNEDQIVFAKKILQYWMKNQ